jgi:DNA-binding transcriptional MocR family regulator
MNPEIRPALTRVEQIEQSITNAIVSGRMPPGSRLPSIRSQARNIGVSPFTVVEAYDRLVAKGLVRSRRGAGFFVQMQEASPHRPVSALVDLPVDEHWLLRNVYGQPDHRIPVGCGWLPASWYDEESQWRAIRAIGREASLAAEYGDPLGFSGLRKFLARQLLLRDIPARPDGVVLTQGASGALSIAAASVARPGDTLLVDAPGYCNLLSSLAYQGYDIVGVPWTAQGPDIAALQALLATCRPKAFFTNPWLQNPTGASYSSRIAHEVLSLAEQHDFLIVEDNVSGDLAPGQTPTLAALDGLDRVIHIGSFSKSLSPGLRVGFFAARQDRVEHMVRIKMMYGMTTPEINERVTLGMLTDGKQRRQLERLRDRLAQAQYRCAERFEHLGWTLFTRPENGLFLLARPPKDQNSVDLASAALQAGILLAPGALFSPHGEKSSWLRFNVAYSDHEALWDFLATGPYTV